MNKSSADILLVEDSEDDTALFVHALAESHPSTQIQIAQDGVEALVMIYGLGQPESSPPIIRPKLIILDLKMPKISGLEVLRILKSNPNTLSIPVVALSSSQEKFDLAESYRLGVNSYLVKPMDFDKFKVAVKILISYWLLYNKPSKQ